MADMDLRCPHCGDEKLTNKKLVKSSPGGFLQNFECRKCKGKYHAHFSLCGATFHKEWEEFEEEE